MHVTAQSNAQRCAPQPGKRSLASAVTPVPPTETSSSSGLFAKNVQVRQCLVRVVRLETFIRTIVKQLDLHLVETVEFNMNSQGVLQRWDDVFRVEKTYTSCLGIDHRKYCCHGYTHHPERRLTYFILEECNVRSHAFLPDFTFLVMVTCQYNESKAVTKVDVEYDQLSFYLHCVGLYGLHRWFVMRVVTPIAKMWMNVFHATGMVNPFTFFLQLFFLPMAVVWYMYVIDNQS